ncbi:phosphotransferase enzyme family protein [Paenibacillus sp. J2TS4]|uniref:phosphotransferase enzyme family protein n=1 Tax=Paenibacillus sp. J2TS4 TaxID=2807194 RepID=UPI001BCB7D2D|nr:phosphotransferase [Paenibacillus sp. J2TS4]
MSTDARVVDDPVIREEVFAHIADTFGVKIYGYVPNFLGLRNMKWSIETTGGPLFVKCYHPQRYPLNEEGRRLDLERSLSFQNYLYENAQICPGILDLNHRYIHRTESGHYYVIMHHMDGRTFKAGQVETAHMHQIGKSTGKMHNLLSRFTNNGSGWKPSITAMREKWKINLEAALEHPNPNDLVMKAIEKQGNILSALDVTMFDSLEQRWAHWDYWVDNIMIGNNDKIMVVDFDNVKFGYPEIDVSRILLSGALCEGDLRLKAVEAFLAGYREEHKLPLGGLPLAFKLLWCREAHWWLKGDMDDFSVPPKRFAEEMIWLTGMWDELDNHYGGL